jgi:hypothetical protein
MFSLWHGGDTLGKISEKCGLGVSPAWVRSMVGEPDRTNSASGASFQDNASSAMTEGAFFWAIVVLFLNI